MRKRRFEPGSPDQPGLRLAVSERPLPDQHRSSHGYDRRCIFETLPRPATPYLGVHLRLHKSSPDSTQNHCFCLRHRPVRGDNCEFLRTASNAFVEEGCLDKYLLASFSLTRPASCRMRSTDERQPIFRPSAAGSNHIVTHQLSFVVPLYFMLGQLRAMIHGSAGSRFLPPVFAPWVSAFLPGGSISMAGEAWD